MDENFREEQDCQFDSEGQTQEQTQTASEQTTEQMNMQNENSSYRQTYGSSNAYEQTGSGQNTMHITSRTHRTACIMEHRDRICILAVHFTPVISMQDITARPAIHQLIRILQEIQHRVQVLPRRM